ncbi:MAG: DNA repair exonuclease [Candidatus Tectomicrobia bacterium]|uniref:DNA repair exonuclease n=1 Tax=Tectimicrobiota bacterium TaxID=2528274 RepID=A0A932CNB9_UNCTE|nr:DNA repair exonuclease [Candidatus Tectomicrobia bacterium]
MPRILHLADLHLGWSPRFLKTLEMERREERNRLLERAVDFALSSEGAIGLVLIAGDLFEDHRPEAALVASVLYQLRRLEAAGVRVVTVPGNHDEISYHDSVYRQRAAEWPGVLVQNPHPARVATLDVGGTPCHIYSLAYTGGLTRATTPLTEFPPAQGPGRHIAVFHGALDWNPGERSLPLSGAGLAQAGYDYIALGHLHRHHAWALPGGRLLSEILPRGVAVYPGMVEGKGFSDPGEGFFTVADLGEKISLRRVPAGVRPVRSERIDAGAFATADELAEALASRGEGQGIQELRLTGSPSFPLPLVALAEKAGPRFYHLEILDETEFLSPEALARLAGEPTIRGQFVRRLQQALEAAPDERQRRLLDRALRLGLAALSPEGRRGA